MTIAKREKAKLNYRFHNPNTPEATADFLVKLFVEVNKPKVEAAIRAAAEESAQKPKESVIAKLRAHQPEREAKPTHQRSKAKSLDPEL